MEKYQKFSNQSNWKKKKKKEINSEQYMTAANDQFHIIIDKYFKSLAFFLQEMRSSTRISIELINNRRKRTNRFDSYVILINKFNDLLYEISIYLKQIISTLTHVFLEKTKESVINFFDAVNTLLGFLAHENVFIQFNEIKNLISKKIKAHDELVDKINKISGIIFKIFHITINVTIMFVPCISFIIPAINILHTIADAEIENLQADMPEFPIDVESIIKKLLSVQVRSEIIQNIDIECMYKCVQNDQSDDLIEVIEQLHTEYVDILNLIIKLKSDIIEYFKKKKRVFFLCL